MDSSNNEINENAKKKLKLENINSEGTDNNNTNNTNNTSNNTSSTATTANNTNNSNNTNNNNNDKQDQSKSKRVYVANVPFDVKWSELKDLFREKVGHVNYCTIFENEDGKSRGCGLLEFQDPAIAAKAIQVMHRFEFKGRDLVVKEDLDCERDRFGRIITNHGNQSNRTREDSQRRDGNNRERGRPAQQQQQQPQQHQPQHQQQLQQQIGNNDSYGYDHSVMSNSFGPSQHLNTFGLSQQFIDSLGITLPLNNRIFVANLEYKVDQNKLEEIFKLAGKVARVKLSHDSQGQSRGYGTVEYEHPVEAVQAISMFHNQKLYGRTMSVRMDKYECEDDVEALPSKLPTGLESIGKGLGVGGQPLNIAKSIMNAALVAPPHLATPGQQIPQMHPQAVHQPAVMQQAVIVAQMQQLQQQQQQQQLQQQHQQQQHQQHQQQQPQQPNAAIPTSLQQPLQRTMQHQLQQPLQTTLPQPLQQPLQQALQQQQYQLHQVSQASQQQSLQPGSIPPPSMTGVQSAYSQLQQISNQAVRPPTSVYQQTPQQQQQQAQPATSTPTTNLSVYSTFERQFREASASRNL